MMSRLMLLLGALLLVGAAEPPKPPAKLSPEEAAKQGRELVENILSQRPDTNITNHGVVRIRRSDGERLQIPVRFEIIADATRWSSVYETTATNDPSADEQLTVLHDDSRPNEYRVVQNGKERELAGNETMIPFAGSDFWVADLGLEFLHWPEQRLLKKQMRRGQPCDVLESVNPHPAPGAYARVVSWIDSDSLGIINAEAYDSQGRLMKEFIAKSVKKVRGQWELKEMEMDNDQTDSRTWIEFNFSSN